MKGAFAGLHEEFPDVRVELESMVAEGDVVAVRLTFSGTHAPTGERATWPEWSSRASPRARLWRVGRLRIPGAAGIALLGRACLLIESRTTYHSLIAAKRSSRKLPSPGSPFSRNRDKESGVDSGDGGVHLVDLEDLWLRLPPCSFRVVLILGLEVFHHLVKMFH